MLSFASDYTEGAHPKLLERLAERNLVPLQGYGADPDTDPNGNPGSDGNADRNACPNPDADSQSDADPQPDARPDANRCAGGRPDDSAECDPEPLRYAQCVQREHAGKQQQKQQVAPPAEKRR